jgi:heme/copper-type cytochrome/quinol oxidase subunit 2
VSRSIGRRVLILFALVVALGPVAPADACQMCMGTGGESKTVAGVQNAMIVLIVITYGMLGWIFFLFVYCYRRAKRREEAQLAEVEEGRAGEVPLV